MTTEVKNSLGQPAFYCFRAKGDKADIEVPAGHFLVVISSDGDAGVVAQGPHEKTNIEIMSDMPSPNWFSMAFIFSPPVADRVVNHMTRQEIVGMVDNLAGEYGLFDRAVMH